MQHHVSQTGKYRTGDSLEQRASMSHVIQTPFLIKSYPSCPRIAFPTSLRPPKVTPCLVAVMLLRSPTHVCSSRRAALQGPRQTRRCSSSPVCPRDKRRTAPGPDDLCNKNRAHGLAESSLDRHAGFPCKHVVCTYGLQTRSYSSAIRTRGRLISTELPVPNTYRPVYCQY